MSTLGGDPSDYIPSSGYWTAEHWFAWYPVRSGELWLRRIVREWHGSYAGGNWEYFTIAEYTAKKLRGER